AHVMIGLWSAEVIHSVRIRAATFRALCPDPDDGLAAWLRGDPPTIGRSSSFVLLDPFAHGRQTSTVNLQHALSGAKPRIRGYREAAERLASERRAGGEPDPVPARIDSAKAAKAAKAARGEQARGAH
ncbi:MAG: hypothetical protein U9O18_07745, partial [Chloroflexota bacterium]|nr:hypothetical protein [Chloroflexota bacterium]